jgi:hypothetical protein
VVVDLFGYPVSTEITLVCTNVRSTTGKRPVWADHMESIFYFPWGQIRFLEIPQDRASPPMESGSTAIALRPPEDESDLEIDEDFLKRVRDV